MKRCGIMSCVSAAAVFFILWWMVLFAMLPFGLKTQDDDDDVTLGTVSSAPRGPHMLQGRDPHDDRFARAVRRFSTALTKGLGYGFDDIPHIVPEFESRR